MENSQTNKKPRRAVRLIVIGVGIFAIIGLLYAFAQRNVEDSTLDETVLSE